MANSVRLNHLIQKAESLNEQIYKAEGLLEATPTNHDWWSFRRNRVEHLKNEWAFVIEQAETLAAIERGLK